VTVHVADDTLAIDLADGDSRIVCRTTKQAVHSIKSPPAPQGQDCP
jgi:hypothetical protein